MRAKFGGIADIRWGAPSAVYPCRVKDDRQQDNAQGVTLPGVLVCAGLDPSGGAGLIADVRSVSALGARPAGVVTAMTVQNTTGTASIVPCDPELVENQLTFLLTDIEVRAVKIGMLCNADVAAALANALQLTNAPVVWDPIAAPTRGSAACAVSLDIIAETLRPHLAVITPNAPELALLAGIPVTDLASAEAAARAVADRFDTAVLVKGGHLGGAHAIDVLIHTGGREQFSAARVAGGEHVHGTGCALSSALATFLAVGEPLPRACLLAKQYVAAQLAAPAHPGRGAAAVM